MAIVITILVLVALRLIAGSIHFSESVKETERAMHESRVRQASAAKRYGY